jgi:hypothetical protein
VCAGRGLGVALVGGFIKAMTSGQGCSSPLSVGERKARGVPFLRAALVGVQ